MSNAVKIRHISHFSWMTHLDYAKAPNVISTSRRWFRQHLAMHHWAKMSIPMIKRKEAAMLRPTIAKGGTIMEWCEEHRRHVQKVRMKPFAIIRLSHTLFYFDWIKGFSRMTSFSRAWHESTPGSPVPLPAGFWCPKSHTCTPKVSIHFYFYR